MKKKSKIDESRLSLVSDYDGSDVSGWLVSRKWNGWRCTYERGDGLRTRNGQLIVMPDGMAKELHAHTPDGVMIDGELTLIIDGVERPELIIRLAVSPDAPEWKDAKFRPFAVIEQYIDRVGIYMAIRSWFVNLNFVVPVVQYVLHVKNVEETIQTARLKINNGWEGIVLTNPASVYTPGRNRDMMRIKASILKR